MTTTFAQRLIDALPVAQLWLHFFGVGAPSSPSPAVGESVLAEHGHTRWQPIALHFQQRDVIAGVTDVSAPPLYRITYRHLPRIVSNDGTQQPELLSIWFVPSNAGRSPALAQFITCRVRQCACLLANGIGCLYDAERCHAGADVPCRTDEDSAFDRMARADDQQPLRTFRRDPAHGELVHVSMRSDAPHPYADHSRNGVVGELFRNDMIALVADEACAAYVESVVHDDSVSHRWRRLMCHLDVLRADVSTLPDVEQRDAVVVGLRAMWAPIDAWFASWVATRMRRTWAAPRFFPCACRQRLPLGQ